MKFGIEQHIIDKLIAIFEQHSKVDKALVFGSRAKGNYRPDSDIDIAIKGPDLNTDDIIAMSVAFEEKGITHKIDLINYDKINEPDLKDHIDRVGIELYSRWREYKILKVGKVVTGNTPSSKFPEEFGNEMPFVTPTDYKNYNKWIYTADRYLSDKGIAKLKSRVLPANSILVTCIGSDMGKIAINKIPVVTNQQINSIIINEKVNADFLYYKLISSYDILRTYGEAGTAVPIVNKGDFENIEITIPSDLKEQTAIATILSSLDDKIDLLHRQNKTLEQLAETLFRQWFVEEAEESWEVGTLDDIAVFSNGKSRPNGVENGKIPIYGGNGILGFTNQSNYEGLSIIIGRVGAYCGSLYLENKPIWLSDNALLTRGKRENFTFYLFYLLKSLELNSMAEGSSHPLLTQTLLKSIDICIPSSQKVLDFNIQVSEFWNSINTNQNQIQTLTKTRDTLLPKLMSGDVRVNL